MTFMGNYKFVPIVDESDWMSSSAVNTLYTRSLMSLMVCRILASKSSTPTTFFFDRWYKPSLRVMVHSI